MTFLLQDKKIEEKFFADLDKELVHITYHPYQQTDTPSGKKIKTLNTDEEITIVATKREEFLPEEVVEDLAFNPEQLFPTNNNMVTVWDTDNERWTVLSKEQIIDFSIVYWQLAKADEAEE